MEILGRIDNQVKINGYRVETGEIESILMNQKEVNRAIVDLNDKKQLIAYIESNKVRSSNLELLKNVHEHVKRKSEDICDDEYENVKRVVLTINQIAEYKILEALKELGVFDDSEKEYTLEGIAAICKVSRKNYNVIKNWIKMLVKNGIVKSIDDKYSLNDNSYLNCYNGDLSLLDNVEFENYRGLINYFKINVNNLRGLLQGTVNPLMLLFPNGNFDLANDVYCNNPLTNYCNCIVKEAVKSYMNNTQGKIKILEVGAGVGSTTEVILDQLDENRVEYYYTDVSSAFNKYAKEKFKKYKFIKYDLYNIDEEPSKFNYNNNEFDLIIGANVIHDAKVIEKTLGYLKGLLTQDGMIVLLEGIEITSYQLVTVAFLEGLGNFEDERKEYETPFLTGEQWKEKFEKLNFEFSESYPNKSFKTMIYGQQVIISGGKSENKLDFKKIGDVLKKSLPKYMVPHHYYELDSIPLTSNGKLDRKRIKQMINDTVVELAITETFVEPRNDLERLISDIWRSVLEVDKVGIDDNFYDLGGDSIKAIQISNLLRKNKVEIDVRNMFMLNTIRDISDFVTCEKSEIHIPSDYEQEIKNNTNFNKITVLFDMELKKEKLQKAIEKVYHHYSVLCEKYDIDEKGIVLKKGSMDNLMKVEIIDGMLSDEKALEVIKNELTFENNSIIKFHILYNASKTYLSIMVNESIIDNEAMVKIVSDINDIYFEKDDLIKYEIVDSEYENWIEEKIQFRDALKIKFIELQDKNDFKTEIYELQIKEYDCISLASKNFDFSKAEILTFVIGKVANKLSKGMMIFNKAIINKNKSIGCYKNFALINVNGIKELPKDMEKMKESIHKDNLKMEYGDNIITFDYEDVSVNIENINIIDNTVIDVKYCRNFLISNLNIRFYEKENSISMVMNYKRGFEYLVNEVLSEIETVISELVSETKSCGADSIIDNFDYKDITLEELDNISGLINS